MTKIAEKPPANPLYEKDFHDWAMEQAVLLRAKRWQDLDLENLAEEVEDMARSQKKEIRSRLEVLVMHLLKWKYQPGRRTPSWKTTVFNQRHDLVELIAEMPSLGPYLREAFQNRYNAARLSAEAETGIAFVLFPDECPFTLEQVMDPEFYPDEPGMYHPTNKLP